MKYIIKEEQVDQSKFKMGPYGHLIRKIIDMYGATFIHKYVVIYLEGYDNYMVIIWSNRGAVSIEVEYKIKKYIEQFIPVDVTVTIIG